MSEALSEYVRYEIRYNTEDEDGETRAQRNKRFGVAVPDAPEVPDSGAHILEWFWQLSSQRAAGMGLEPIQWRDIAEFDRLLGLQIRPVEATIIVEMDRALRGEINREQQAKRDAEKQNRG